MYVGFVYGLSCCWFLRSLDNLDELVWRKIDLIVVVYFTEFEKKWKNKFRSQVTKAYALLKKYDDVAIINALKSPAGKRIYSLRLKNLETLIQKEQKQIDVQNSQVAPPKEYNSDGSNAPRKPYGKKSNAQKLRELDG